MINQKTVNRLMLIMINVNQAQLCLQAMNKKYEFLPKPEVVFKIEKNGKWNRFVMLQRPYIPNFKSLGHMVRPRDSFKINLGYKGKNFKIAISRSIIKFQKTKRTKSR